MRSGTYILMLALLLLAAGAMWSVADDPEAAPTRIHPDPEKLMADFQRATRAAVLLNPVELREALDLVKEGSVKIHDTDIGDYPGSIRKLDQGFHFALNAAREKAGEGKRRAAFDQYQYVERGCKLCHYTALREGIMVAGSGVEPPVSDTDPSN